jgi:hypothetical protein
VHLRRVSDVEDPGPHSHPLNKQHAAGLSIDYILEDVTTQNGRRKPRALPAEQPLASLSQDKPIRRSRRLARVEWMSAAGLPHGVPCSTVAMISVERKVSKRPSWHQDTKSARVVGLRSDPIVLVHDVFHNCVLARNRKMDTVQ